MAILNGIDYTNTMFTGLGYKDYFPEPIFDDMLTELQSWLTDFETIRDATEAFRNAASGFADDAQASAIAAAAAAVDIQGTSTTSLSVGSGTKTLTTQTGKAFIVGMNLRYARTSNAANQWMDGICTAYNSGTGSLSIVVGSVSGTDYLATGGTGPYTDWTISFVGDQGPAGAAGADGIVTIATATGTADAITATYSTPLTLTDKKVCLLVPASDNTSTTPTFAPDGLTAQTITKGGGQALLPGDIKALSTILLEYNLANTRWELLNPQIPAPNAYHAMACMALLGV